MIEESDPFFSKLFNSHCKSRRPLPSRRKHPSQTVVVIYRYWRKDAKTGGAGNSNHLLFNAKTHVIEKSSQCTSNTSSQISINSVCDNNTYYLRDRPFLWKAHSFLDEPRGEGRQDFQWELNNFEKRGLIPQSLIAL